MSVGDGGGGCVAQVCVSATSKERRQTRRTECRRDWLNGTFFPLSRMAQEEGGGVCGWVQAKALGIASDSVDPVSYVFCCGARCSRCVDVLVKHG